MNVFVLNSGRCGSTTFIEACRHISNYSAAHESRVTHIGEQRLAYPDNHIEADNRLCWFLGRLEKHFGDNAFYVHLHRNIDDTVASFARRYSFGIMQAYREGILMEGRNDQSATDIATDYIDTVESGIALFLKDKTMTLDFSLENAKNDFAIFWDAIGADGDLDRALSTWDTVHNASD